MGTKGNLLCSKVDKIVGFEFEMWKEGRGWGSAPIKLKTYKLLLTQKGD